MYRHDRLGPGTEEDLPRPAMVLGLVSRGCVFPDLTVPADVARPQGDDLARSCPAEQLQPDHVPNLTRDVREHRVHVGFLGRQHRPLLSRPRAALSETRDRPEPVQHRRRDELVLDGPGEHPPDPADAPVHRRSALAPGLRFAPGVASAKQVLPDALQLGRPEVGRRGRSVEPAERPQWGLEGRELARGLPVLAVVPLGVTPVGEYQLVDRERRRDGGLGDGRRRLTGEQLGDEAAVFLLGLGAAVATEVNMPAVDQDAGLTRAGMAAEGGDERLTRQQTRLRKGRR